MSVCQPFVSTDNYFVTTVQKTPIINQEYTDDLKRARQRQVRFEKMLQLASVSHMLQ